MCHDSDGNTTTFELLIEYVQPIVNKALSSYKDCTQKHQTIINTITHGIVSPQFVGEFSSYVATVILL